MAYPRKEGWNCPKCQQHFRTLAEMKFHHKTHPNPTAAIPTKCYCGMEFSTKLLCRIHRGKCPEAIKIANQHRAEADIENLKKANKFLKEHPDLKKKWQLEAVTKAANSPEVRAIRAQTMARLNKTAQFKATASITAIKTSARPEIQQQRAERLAIWRKNNPEKMTIITNKAIKAAKKSKAEEWLAVNLLNSLGYQRLAKIQCGEKLKQVDFLKDNMIIEVDGCWHFGQDFSTKKRKVNPLKTHQRDIMLIQEVEKRQSTLIRVGIGCYNGNGKMRAAWLEILLKLLVEKLKGIWLLGKYYQLGLWVNDICTTWKYVTHPTIFSSLME